MNGHAKAGTFATEYVTRYVRVPLPEANGSTTLNRSVDDYDYTVERISITESLWRQILRFEDWLKGMRDIREENGCLTEESCKELDETGKQLANLKETVAGWMISIGKGDELGKPRMI